MRKNLSIFPSWWLRGGCVISFHAQNSAHPQQLRGNERQPRSTKIAYGDTARHHPGPQRGLQPEHVLAGTPPPTDQQSRVIVDERQEHRPIRVKAARSYSASIRNIRMANDHAHKSLSWILRPRTDVTRRSTGAALRPASDDVAPTRAGVSLERRAVRERSREAGRQVDGTINHVVRRGPSTVPTVHDATRRA